MSRARACRPRYWGRRWPPPLPLRGELWARAGGAWELLDAKGPGARTLSGAAYDSRRGVVVYGGIGVVNQNRNGDTWEWDGTAWLQAARDGPPPRARHRMAFDGNPATVLLYGGNAEQKEPRDGFELLADTWAWDGSRWTEHRIDIGGPGARFMHAMAWDEARRRVVLYGGGRDERDGARRIQSSQDDTEWDGARWIQAIAPGR